MTRVAVLNAGGWGTALACVLAASGHSVRLWARRPELAHELRDSRENSVYLRGVQLPARVEPTAELEAALDGATAVVLATTSTGLRDLVRSAAPLIRGDPLMLVGTKGLERETWLRPSEVLVAELGPRAARRIGVLSGPTHAEEVARGRPTAAVLASAPLDTAYALRTLLGTPAFRLYTSSDVVGVELCAAAKNCVAIAAGIGDGLGYGDNAKAALITRSLAEIGRLVAAYEGDPRTVAGLAGIGDLVATCASRLSRNRWAGEELGRGRPLRQVLSSTAMVVEGIPATRGIVALGRAAGVELPICEAVRRVLYDDQDPAAAIAELLARSPRDE
jgi:glycerol-3-phosphate dehydrogenase (NAD(P)+)